MNDFEKLQAAVTDLAEHCRKVGDERERVSHDMGERVKQIDFLCRLARLCHDNEREIGDVLRDAVDLVPPLWRYPDETCARITIDDRQYKTTNFIVETPWRHAADISVFGEKVGCFEVFYTEEPVPDYEGLLLWHDEEFLNTVARHIGLYIEHYRLTHQLQEAKKNAEESKARLAASLPKLKMIRNRADDTLRAFGQFMAASAREIQDRLREIRSLGQVCSGSDDDIAGRVDEPGMERPFVALEKFIRDITEYADLEAGNFRPDLEPFHLRRLICDTLNSYGDLHPGSGGEYISFVDPLVPDEVIGDSRRLKQIIDNLLAFSAWRVETGEITVRVKMEVSAHLLPIFHFSVHDTGRRITDAEGIGVFERTDWTSQVLPAGRVSTSLGLINARQLVELMGGEMWIESPPIDSPESADTGAAVNFTMWLDVRKDRANSELRPETIDAKPGRALVITGSDANCRMFSSLLEFRGWDVVAASDGSRGMELLKAGTENEKPVSVVIADIDLSDIDGFDLARGIAGDGRYGGPAVILTAYRRQPEDFDLSEHPGVSAVLTRPVHEPTLHETIAAAFEKTGKSTPPPVDDDNRSGSTGETDNVKIHDGRGRHVLLIDSDRITRMLTARLLEKRNYQITAVSCGPEAIEAAQNGNFSVALLDACPPEPEHTEAIRLMCRDDDPDRRRLPVMVLVDKIDQTERDRYLEAGADRLISKTDGLEGVLKGIDELAPDEPQGDTGGESEEAEKNARFDYEKALTGVEGDHGLLLEILEVFEDEISAYLSRMDTAMINGDRTALAASARCLATAADKLGAGVIHTLAREIEIAAVEGEIENMSTRLDRLGGEVREFERETSRIEQDLTNLV